MTLRNYIRIKAAVIDAGYASEIIWQRDVTHPIDADTFAREVIFVICNSGMKSQVARGIYNRVMQKLTCNYPVSAVFGHQLKVRAIESHWRNRQELFDRYNSLWTDGQRIDFLCRLDHIGHITKWHLAKNFGLNVVKPDRHLTRIAKAERKTPQKMCEAIAAESGDKVSVVDYVLWRAANLGML